jgi:predicted O-linked N-acetylglucosamine transferase (SPINDLY family)
MIPAQALAQARGALGRGELDAAEAVLRPLLDIAPGESEGWRLHGAVALARGELPLAMQRITRALKLDAQNVDAWCELAALYLATGQPAQAFSAASRATTLAPSLARGWTLAGLSLDAQGSHREAAGAFELALGNGDRSALAHANLASARLACGDLPEAEQAARKACEADQAQAAGWQVLGSVLAANGRAADAAEAFRQAIARDPSLAPAHYNLALALDDVGDLPDAAAACTAALALDPQLWPALAQGVFLKRRLCDWAGLDALSTRLRSAVAAGAPGLTPFSFLAEPARPDEQLQCARLWARQRQADAEARRGELAPAPAARNARDLRVGFVSNGFNNHPTALLVVELIERLRGTRLRSFGFATSADDGGAMRRRLRAGFDEFHDLTGMDPATMTHSVRACGLDVLVDLRGYGGGAVTELFALRGAPLQVNWLAYPGTSGASFIDYLIADAVVVPPAERAHYSEALVRLPRAFQPSDSTRAVREPPPRAVLGLPGQGTVLASFNNTYKIAPEVFSAWMRVLDGVPGSVLWLLAGHAASNAHLRAAATAAGVDPARLVFQPKLPHDEYLALYRHADLFLDTWPYGAHTTASDALWAGCPVLTLPGRTFASRVAASLLTTLGLEDQIATGTDDYVARARALGSDASARLGLRARLAQARMNSGLFDMAAFARDFETAMVGMVERQRRGEAPTDFDVPA